MFCIPSPGASSRCPAQAVVCRRPRLLRCGPTPLGRAARPAQWHGPIGRNHIAYHVCFPCRLPVPSLSATLGRLRESAAAAAASDEERDAALAAIDAWSAPMSLPGPDPEGYEGEPALGPSDAASILHETLCAHATRACNPNPMLDEHSWLREWWNVESYLAFREPLPLNVSYWFLLQPPRTAEAAPGASSGSGGEDMLPASAARGAPDDAPGVRGAWASLDNHGRQAARGAALVCAWLCQRDRLLRGVFPVESRPRAARGSKGRGKSGGVAPSPAPAPGPSGTPGRLTAGRLCPLGWDKLFHSLRRPLPGQDAVSSRWPALTACRRAGGASEDPAWIDAVVVLRRGCAWEVEVQGGGGGGGYDAASLAASLRRVIEECDAADGTPTAGRGLGAATALPRDRWAHHAGRVMVAGGAGGRAAEAIARSALVLCLDPRDVGADVDASSRLLLHGDLPTGASPAGPGDSATATAAAAAATAAAASSGAADRWYDKPVQLVVCGGALPAAGVVAEHSLVDGMPVAALAVAAAADEAAWTARAVCGTAGPAGPARLLFPWGWEAGAAGAGDAAAGDAAAAAVRDGVGSLAALASGHVCHSVSLGAVGASLIKKRCRVAPDAFVQGLWQLTWAIAHIAATPAGRAVPPPSAWPTAAGTSGGPKLATAGPAGRKPGPAGGPGAGNGAIAPGASVLAAPDGAGAAGGARLPFPLAGQYEPTHTRSFRGSRTACVRGLTAESREWVRQALGMVETDASAIGWESCVSGAAGRGQSDDARFRADRAERAVSAMRSAAAAHRAGTILALKGQDADRHLFGMRQVLARALQSPRASLLAWPDDAVGAQRSRAADGAATRVFPDKDGRPFQVLGVTQGPEVCESIPALTRAVFSSPAVARAGRWRISTSNLGSPRIANWGWGQVVPDGVGVAYSVHADRVSANVVGRADFAPVHDPGTAAPAAADRSPQWEAATELLRESFARFARLDGSGSSSALASAFAWAAPIAARLAVAVVSLSEGTGPRPSRL